VQEEAKELEQFTAQTAAVEESAEELQAQIEALNARLASKMDADSGPPIEQVQFPFATVHIKINKQQSVIKPNVAPPELLILIAMHHASAGGNPVVNVTPNGKTEVDPIAYRNALSNRYGAERVLAAFPGTLPNFAGCRSFQQAMNAGMGTKLPDQRLITMPLVAAGE